MRDDHLKSPLAPNQCVCGSAARIRYRIPVTWVECKHKCGMKTGYFADGQEQCDPEARMEAVKAWNKMISAIDKTYN
jgi:hypothetical protein